MFQEEYKYVELYEAFNLKRGTLDRELPARVSEIKKAREKQIASDELASKLKSDTSLLKRIADKACVTPKECFSQLKQLGIEYELLKCIEENESDPFDFFNIYFEKESENYESQWDFLEMIICSNYEKSGDEWRFVPFPGII